MSEAVLQTSAGDLPVRRGKVRDVFDLGDRLLIVSTDRISAFDWVLPTGIPGKGRILNQLSAFWFETLGEPHHLLAVGDEALQVLPAGVDPKLFAGRSMLARKTRVIPIECVVRGYLSGSGWQQYQETGTVCGVELPPGLVESQKLPQPIFTPTTKEDHGHDEGISLDEVVARVGRETAEQLKQRSIDVYRRGAEHAAARGIIIADTKFEWGWDGDRLILIDEALTPDSSRFWPADEYRPGGPQPSYDKQFVRDWLTSTTWDKNSPPPPLPDDVVARTRQKYLEAFERLSGRQLV